MSDSSEREALDEKHARNEERRIQAVKRWIAYIESNPPEKWGPQLNSLVNSQVRAAREADLPAEQYRRVAEATADEPSRTSPDEASRSNE